MRRRNAASPRDAGTTLVELLTAMVLFSLLLGGTGAFVASMARAQRQVEDRGSRLAQANSALGLFDRQLRSGNVLYDPAAAVTPTATPAEVQRLRVYTQANGMQKCVEWRLYGSTQGLSLERRSWDPAWRTTGQITPWEAAATDLVLATTSAFTVQDSGRRVRLTFDVRPARGETRVISVSTSVTGRNTEYGYNTLVCNDVPA